MYKINISKKSIKYLDDYFSIYCSYFESLYEDSWIWSEDQIIDWYIQESTKRKDEIIDLINNKLSDNSVLWRTLEKISSQPRG